MAEDDDDDVPRFRVISGGTPLEQPDPYRNISGESETLVPLACPRCQNSALVQLRIGAVEVRTAKGMRLRGGSLYWACANCLTTLYRIKDYPTTP